MTDLPTENAKPRAPGLMRSSAIFASLTLVSRFLGLARDLVITAKLGASQTIAADAYYTALTFPNLTQPSAGFRFDLKVLDATKTVSLTAGKLIIVRATKPDGQFANTAARAITATVSATAAP